jgi:hypothetical protein
MDGYRFPEGRRGANRPVRQDAVEALVWEQVIHRASRRELFERLDQPALRPLSAEAFVYSDWKIGVRVNIDYHIELHGHYYSVPYALVPEHVDACLTTTTVEIFHRGQRLGPSAELRPRPPHHRPCPHAEGASAPPRVDPLAPHRLGRTIDPQTAALVEAILADRRHPEQGYRSCLGILRLAKRYSPARLEAACARAVAVDARSYRHGLRRSREVDRLHSAGVTQVRNSGGRVDQEPDGKRNEGHRPRLMRSGPHTRERPGEKARVRGWPRRRPWERAPETGVRGQPWGSRRDGPSIRMVVHWWRSRLRRAVTMGLLPRKLNQSS